MLSIVQFQRQVMENYIKQKRATPGMVQANDLQILRPMSGSTAMSSAVPIAPAVRVSSGRELHAYDGPMQFMMSPNNPDQLTNEPISPSRNGKRLRSQRPTERAFKSLFCSSHLAAQTQSTPFRTTWKTRRAPRSR